MVGTGDPPSSFIVRQIQGLEALGVRVERLPEPRHRKELVARLVQRGYVFPLSRTGLESARKADIIHYQWPGHLYRYGAVAKKLGKPVVLSLRGRQINIRPYLPGSEGYVRRLRESLARADAFHCVSRAIMEEARGFGVDPERSRIIRPAVDTSHFRPSNAVSERPEVSIIMVGALMWRKAYEHALVALSKLSSRVPWRASIVGSGEDEDHIRYTIDDLDLGERVSLSGQRTPDEVRDLLLASDILLHSSVSEGIANVAIEAMACGVPVIAADSGGMAEAVRDGVEGRVVAPRDSDAMASALEDLISDPAKRSSMGAAARARAVAEFDSAAQAGAFVDLYRWVLER